MASCEAPVMRGNLDRPPCDRKRQHFGGFRNDAPHMPLDHGISQI